MNYTITVKPETEFTFLNKCAFAMFLPEFFSGLEEVALETQITLQQETNEMARASYKCFLEIIANAMQIYNSKITDYQVLVKFICYLEAIQLNSKTAASLKLAAEITHENIAKTLMELKLIGSIDYL